MKPAVLWQNLLATARAHLQIHNGKWGQEASMGKAVWVSRGDLPRKVGTRFESSSWKGKGKKDKAQSRRRHSMGFGD